MRMTSRRQETPVIPKVPYDFSATNQCSAWMSLLAILLLVPGTLTKLAGQETTPSSASGSDELPWKRDSKRSPRPPAETEITAHMFLQQKGIVESQLQSLTNDSSWSPEAEDTTVKILYHLPTISPHYIHRWSDKPAPWQALASNPEEHQVHFFRIKGRLKQIEKKTIISEAARLVHFDHYYQAQITIPGTPHTAIVCTRHFPASWKPGEDMDERIEVAGLFLKLGAQESAGQTFYFAAPRITWLPDRLDKAAGISKYHLLLANMGVDIGLFSHITRQTRHEFTGDERACFFQLLSAVSKTTSANLSRKQPRKLKIPELLRNTTRAQGQLFTLEGTARRITRIVVEDTSVQEQFKADIDGDGHDDLLDHYCQIDMFVSLKGKSVQVKKDANDKDAPVFSNVYPVNVCVRTLPPELLKMNQELASDNPSQDLLRAHVRLQGFFFKTWSYQTAYASSKDDEGFQTSPIFIATEPEVIPTEIVRSPYIGVMVAVVFTIILIGCWFYIWKNNRADRQFKKTILKRSLEPTDLESLNQLAESTDIRAEKPTTLS